MQPVNIGIIGCGAISGAYLNHGKNLKILNMAACADLNMDAAKKRAAEFGVPKVCTPDEIFADDSIDIVLNLTIPAVHAEIALKALDAGKHVYSEKPLAVNRAEGQAVVKKAKDKGLRVGNAPDTFFGAGHQTARKLIDDGAIGRPVAATAFCMGRGHEGWHPSPEFYYKPGGGPMFDMGPYYLTDLMHLLGPVNRVTGFTSIAIPERTITSQPLHGRKITVETADHLSGTLEFASGVVGTIVTSFAVMGAEFWPITIFGTEGTLKVPDPNGFDGEVHLLRAGGDGWQTVEHTHPTGLGRSVGLADMAHAIRSGRRHRASLEQAFAVLEAMDGILTSSAQGKAVNLTPGYERPAPLPTTLPDGLLDD